MCAYIMYVMMYAYIMYVYVVYAPIQIFVDLFFKTAKILLYSGLCALIGLSIFTVNKKYGVKYIYGGGQFYAQYWELVQPIAVVNGGEYKVETWLRWSYGIGWGGVGWTFFALLCAIFADIIPKQ